MGGSIVGEVELRRVAVEAVGCLVVSERHLLSGVEGAEPKADLHHPLALVLLPHAAVQLLWARQRCGHRCLQELRSWAVDLKTTTNRDYVFFGFFLSSERTNQTEKKYQQPQEKQAAPVHLSALRIRIGSARGV
jgi:hypothetical protein